MIRAHDSFQFPGLLWGTLAICILTGNPAQAQTVTSLTVRSATSQRVELSWSGTASSYTVRRRILGQSYSDIATVSTTAASDTQIDPYTTYQYEVVASTVSGASAPSNEVTVGPPPAGFTVADPSPGGPGTTAAGSYGYSLSVVLDANGDPAFAFVFNDPNGDTDPADSQVRFRSWNRAKYAWNPDVIAGTVGGIATTFHTTTVLARDAGTNAYAIASEVASGSNQVQVFVSTDNGATWTSKAKFQADTDVKDPSLALGGGNIYLAYVVDFDGLKYVTGSLSADPSTWQTKSAPKPAGTDRAEPAVSTSLALDTAGNPGIAYWAHDLNATDNEILLFWRPASGADPVKVLDSQNQPTDMNVRLVFHNLNPRILAYVQRKDAPSGVALHFSRSDDGGLTWTTPVVIPPDGNSSTDFPADLAVSSQDHGAVFFGQNSGSGDAVCGNPKLSRSDDLVNWKTCAVAGVDVTGDFEGYPGAVAVTFGGNDKLYLLWWNAYDNPTGTGILMYREPPANAPTAPNISSIVSAADFQPGIVAGSWVAIMGSNFSDVTRIWKDSDFNGDVLPTDLSGVEVKINGLSAPVYFVSPTQLNVEAPADISGNVQVQVTHNGVTSNNLTANAVQNAPGLFAYTVGSKTFPAAVFPSGVIVGDPAAVASTQKAHPGDRILLYATGLGPSPAGDIIHSPIGFQGNVTVTIGSADATVEYAGLVAVGEFQINIVVPQLPDGEYPVVLHVAGQSSQTGVILPITH